MISKNTIKLIKSLAHKKYRQKHQLFLVEGEKNVLEVLDSSFQVPQLFGTERFLQNNSGRITKANIVAEASTDEIKKASLLKSPQDCLALCALPKENTTPPQLESFTFYLDGIQDPGNLGTIIRTCDWFGAKTIYCSPDTADIYNPKVIQASMGSFVRVKVFYTPFAQLAEIVAQTQTEIMGTFMDGENIYNTPLPEKAVVVLGNEGKGVSPEVAAKVERKLSIPRFHNENDGPESLNVGVTAAIICSEFKRRKTF
jgi:TrmH family RNA methyltransferase